MAIWKSKDMEDELILNCKCGCNETIHFVVDKSWSTYDDYAFMAVLNPRYRTEQGRLKYKLMKIWNIIFNKDFYIFDIRMNKDEFEEFADWIAAQKGEE